MNLTHSLFPSLAIAALLTSPGLGQNQTTAALEIRLGKQCAGYRCVLESPSILPSGGRTAVADASGRVLLRLLPPGDLTLKVFTQEALLLRSAQLHLEAGETKVMDPLAPMPFPALLPPPKGAIRTMQALQPENPVLAKISGIRMLPANALPSTLPFPKGKLSLCVFPDHAFQDPTQPESLAGIFNDTDQDASIETYNPVGAMRFEAKRSWGLWKAIEYSPWDGKALAICGTGLSDGTILPARSCVIFPVRRYQGPYRTKLRLRCGDLVSEPFEGSIEPDQFKKPRLPAGH